MTTITIDEELRSLIPPLTDEERTTLAASIAEEGVREAIVTTMDGVIVDGHNRYEIAKEQGFHESVIPVERRYFADRDEIMLWMIDNQRGRRNLSPGAWAELGIKRSSLLESKAEQARIEGNRKGGKSSLTLDSTSDEPTEKIDTLAEAAKYSGLSRATVAKAKKVYESDDDELKQAVRTGEKSINKAYQEIKKPAVQPAPEPVQEPDTDEPEVIDEINFDDVDDAPTEARQKKQGYGIALQTIDRLRKELADVTTITKHTALSEILQWITGEING